MNATLYQFPETLSQEVLDKMHAVKLDIPVIKVEDLAKADGFIFGFPTRFGRAPAQVYAFWDATSSLWYKGELSGKYAGLFTSTATQHGGQETTPFTFIPTLAHHGLLYVPFGYTSGLLNDNSEVMGGSPVSIYFTKEMHSYL